jgi:hypothetical protein
MPKLIRATWDWGFEYRGGSEVSGEPGHWTVCRDKFQTNSFPFAKRNAKSCNLHEDKERWKLLSKFRNVFDQKSLKEFRRPEGMTTPKFALCEKVWAVRPDVWGPVAAKGIIYAARWSEPLKTWLYEVAWYERVKDAPEGSKRNQYVLGTRNFLEENLYKFEDKEKARELFIGTMAKILKWVSDFEDRLHNLKPKDLKEGEYLK